MLIKFATAVPTYGDQLHRHHCDMHILLAEEAMRSRVAHDVAMAQRKPADHRLVGVDQPLGFVRVTSIFATSCDVAHSRNLMLHAALRLPTEQRPDWLLMVDADIAERDPRRILGMILAGTQREAAVIAAPVATRSGMLNAILPKAILPAQREELRLRVQPVSRIGTGFMAIDLGWIAAHWPAGPWFAFREAIGVAGEPVMHGEDYHFCDGVAERKGIILVDGRLEPWHANGLYPPAGQRAERVQLPESSTIH